MICTDGLPTAMTVASAHALHIVITTDIHHPIDIVMMEVTMIAMMVTIAVIAVNAVIAMLVMTVTIAVIAAVLRHAVVTLLTWVLAAVGNPDRVLLDSCAWIGILHCSSQAIADEEVVHIAHDLVRNNEI